MSATHEEIRFSVVVADVDHWTPEHVAAADAEPADAELGGGYSDWAADQLRAEMRAAGERFIAANPDLFTTGDLI